MVEIMDDAQLGCIWNNAEWCDLVCRSHSVPGTYEPCLWIRPGIGPEFYPNIITLTRGDEQEQTERISELLALRSGISVKDSFSALDLSTIGMRRLFDAEWVWMDPMPARLSFNPNERWSRIESAAELVHWQSAWRGTCVGPPVFLPSLLENSSVTFLAAWSGAAIVAGCVLNRDANGIVGGIEPVFSFGWTRCVFRCRNPSRRSVCPRGAFGRIRKRRRTDPNEVLRFSPGWGSQYLGIDDGHSVA